MNCSQISNMNLLKHQRGDFLIESMIGTLLTAIVALGVIFITGKVSLAQNQLATQEIVVDQMRAFLQKNGSGVTLCGSTNNLTYIKSSGVKETKPLLTATCGSVPNQQINFNNVKYNVDLVKPIILTVQGQDVDSSVKDFQLGG